MAVIVDKKRIIHDATHVKVNNRIKCRDKLRAPGAREKKQLLRELESEGEVAYSVVGDISKAHRREKKHQASEHGYIVARSTRRRRSPVTRIASLSTSTRWAPLGFPRLATGGPGQQLAE